MAVQKPSPNFKTTDLFILNRPGAPDVTYKITYADMVANLKFTLQGGNVNDPDATPDPGLLFVNDLGDASTVLKRKDDGSGTEPIDITGGTAINWLLQYDTGVSQFVLSDPKNFLNQALELNNLKDVTTKNSTGDYIVSQVGSGVANT